MMQPNCGKVQTRAERVARAVELVDWIPRQVARLTTLASISGAAIADAELARELAELAQAYRDTRWRAVAMIAAADRGQWGDVAEQWHHAQLELEQLEARGRELGAWGIV